SYVFGTVHIICSDKYVWTKSMQNSFEKCDEVCFEMDMDDPSLMTKIAFGMMARDGKTLNSYFSNEDYLILKKYFIDSIGVDISAFASMKPIVLQTLLATGPVTCDSPMSYEVQLSEKAANFKKEITGLESPEEQIQLLDKIPVDSIVAEVVRIIHGEQDESGMYEDLINAYSNQNLPEVYSFILQAKEDGDDMNVFIDERNEKWIVRMVEKMEQKPTFFAVGAGHLYGEKGLISLLRQSGYTVKPVR
ncbi:MAG: TraB/GumN family protein, partial [Chitinophagaceae bacterium]|nr:TraB/GumN family protein [Chitinophagaceae bacterium]